MKKFISLLFALCFAALPAQAGMNNPSLLQTTGTFTPVANSFTVVGSAPTLTGFYIKTGFTVTLVISLVCNAGCTTTASVAGTSFFSGGPFTPSTPGAAACAGSADNTSGVNKGGGYYNVNFFTPAWAATADTLISTCTFQSTT